MKTLEERAIDYSKNKEYPYSLEKARVDFINCYKDGAIDLLRTIESRKFNSINELIIFIKEYIIKDKI